MSEQNIQRQQDSREERSYDDPLTELERLLLGEDSVSTTSPAPTSQSMEGSLDPSLVQGEKSDTPEEYFTQDVSLDAQSLAGEDQPGERFADENMTLKSLLLAELNNAPVSEIFHTSEAFPQADSVDEPHDPGNEKFSFAAEERKFIAAAQAAKERLADEKMADLNPNDEGIDQNDLAAVSNSEVEQDSSGDEYPDIATAPADLGKNTSSMNIGQAFSDAFANELSLEMDDPQGNLAPQSSPPSDFGNVEDSLPVENEIQESGELQVDPNKTGPQPTLRLEKKSSGFRMAAVALGLAGLTGLAVVAYSLLDENKIADMPVLVPAIKSDYKVKPENLFGKELTNQYDPVYETIEKGNAGGNPSMGTQNKLVIIDEAPVDLAPKLDSVTNQASENPDSQNTGGKVREINTPVAFIQPHKVKTFTVGADGTIAASAEVDEGQSTDTVFGQGASELPANSGQANPGTIDRAVSTGKIPVPVQNPNN